MTSRSRVAGGEMRIGIALLACVTGAAAFTAPMPGALRRFGSAMPVGVSPMRSLAPRPLSLAMNSKRGQLKLQTAETEPRREVERIAGVGSGLIRSVGKVALLSLASMLLFSGAAFAWGAAAAPPPPAADAYLFGYRTADGAIVGVTNAMFSDAKFWGFLGAIAGWGMSLAAIKDAATAGVEIISENLTFVMIIYSSLFAWWAFIVNPQNLLLCACHTVNVLAQGNQMRRLLAHKAAIGRGDEVSAMGVKAACVAAGGAAAIVGGPIVQSAIVGANLGGLSAFAAAKAGPFTVHFWAPMSKWLISGASFLDLNKPTNKISLAQYAALTLTGFFFVPYALLVNPINYVLASVNIALFISSAWLLGRKAQILKSQYTTTF